MSSDRANGSLRHDNLKIEVPYLSSMNICLIGYLAIQGLEDLRDFLLKRTETLGLIGLVPPHSRSIRPLVCIYASGKQIEVSKAIREKPTNYGRLWAIFYILDALSIFFAALRMKRRFHLTIGISYVPAMVAVLLKKIGLTNHSIYYCYDYVQSVKESSLFKRIVATAFYIVDSRIVKWSDLTWNLTEPIGTIREKLAHRHRSAYLPQLTVPRPLFQKADVTPKLNSNTAIYMGYLRSNQGVEQIIEAVPIILKHIPDFRLLMIGSGPEEGRLRELAKNIGVDDHVIFHGYVKAGARLIELLSSASLGLAIYAPSSNSGLRWYIDPSKVRTYVQYYVPVVTNVSPIMLGRLKESNAIIRILDGKDALSQTVVRLLRNRQLLYKMQASINDLLDDYRAEHIFDDALAKSARIL